MWDKLIYSSIEHATLSLLTLSFSQRTEGRVRTLKTINKEKKKRRSRVANGKTLSEMVRNHKTEE